LPLTLDQADKIVDAACQKAAELGIRVGTSVVDPGGHLIAFKRMDGSGVIVADMSQWKAFTSLAFGGADTLTLKQRIGSMPFFAAGPEITGGRVVMLGGGVPVRQGQELLGAVGVGGGTEEQDDECARAGITAALG